MFKSILAAALGGQKPSPLQVPEGRDYSPVVFAAVALAIVGAMVYLLKK